LRQALRELRLERGVRQREIARRLARPQSFVSKYESGERALDFVEVDELCEILGITLAELVARLRALDREAHAT
jgi:transcriptional regulator with XRE-family HTH domain